MNKIALLILLVIASCSSHKQNSRTYASAQKYGCELKEQVALELDHYYELKEELEAYIEQAQQEIIAKYGEQKRKIATSEELSLMKSKIIEYFDRTIDTPISFYMPKSKTKVIRRAIQTHSRVRGLNSYIKTITDKSDAFAQGYQKANCL